MKAKTKIKYVLDKKDLQEQHSKVLNRIERLETKTSQIHPLKRLDKFKNYYVLSRMCVFFVCIGCWFILCLRCEFCFFLVCSKFENEC